MKQFLGFIVLIFFVFLAKAEPVPGANNPEKSTDAAAGNSLKPAYIMCKNNNVVRTIRIEKIKNNCKTTYTKDGVDSVVGKSGSDALCRDVFDKIKENLEKASWKCKDITQSRVSISTVEP